MKDKKVINNLKILQSFQPDKQTLQKIHREIMSQQQGSKGFALNFGKWFSLTSLIPLVSFAVVIFFILVAINFSSEIQNAIVAVKIVTAHNHYEKAKIALSYVQSGIISFQNDPLNKSKIATLSDSLALANTEMSGLQLVGEKGKYTSYQCLELYEAYHEDLEKINNAMKSNSSETGNLLDTQVNQYDLQSKEKLKDYNNRTWKENEK